MRAHFCHRTVILKENNGKCKAKDLNNPTEDHKSEQIVDSDSLIENFLSFDEDESKDCNEEVPRERPGDVHGGRKAVDDAKVSAEN